VTTNYAELIDDPEIDLLVVATRHGLHAEIATEALDAGLDIHVEKPLALDTDQLASVVRAEQASDARLMVGYNRRFSTAAQTLSDRFATSSTPLMTQYRVNTDRLPADHWVYDSKEGGGRIVGEMCHFVDFLQYVADAPPIEVYAVSPDAGDGSRPDDNVQTVVRFADGSQATITYSSLGGDDVAKEHIEVFGDGIVETVDNFKKGRLKLRQDKGFASEFEAFANAIRSGEPSPISVSELVATSRATFAIKDSIRTGETVAVERDLTTLLE
jgi:predicted dehydrogenase